MADPPDSMEQAERMLDELEQLERKLRRLETRLERSHRLATVGTMASIVAHEVNNLLTPVISYCQLARNHPDDAALQQKAIDRAFSGAQQAARINDSLLGFSRDDTATDAEACRVQQVVEEVFRCLARAPEKDGIELGVEVPDACCVAMTPGNLQQVLLNLVLNARRALRRQGGGRLTIRAGFADEQHRRVTIEVADTGPGIDAALRDQLFEPFVTDQQDDRGEQSTGLGLAVCKDLVEYVGGTIELAGSDAGGTSFRLELPAADPAHCREPAGSSAAAQSGSDSEAA